MRVFAPRFPEEKARRLTRPLLSVVPSPSPNPLPSRERAYGWDFTRRDRSV